MVSLEKHQPAWVPLGNTVKTFIVDECWPLDQLGLIPHVLSHAWRGPVDQTSRMVDVMNTRLGQAWFGRNPIACMVACASCALYGDNIVDSLAI